MGKNFDYDLANGLKYENIVAYELSKIGYDFIRKNIECNGEYDLLIRNKNNHGKLETVEVKSDEYCVFMNRERTVFIEFKNINTDSYSGINVSKSDYYAFYMTNLNEIYLIETNKLKWICNNCKLEIRVNKGEDATLGYILPIKDYIDYFCNIITGLKYVEEQYELTDEEKNETIKNLLITNKLKNENNETTTN